MKLEIELLGWDEDALRARRKGHRAKVMLARRIREEGASGHCPRRHSQRNGARTSCPFWASNVHRSPRVVEWHPKRTGCPRAGGSARLRPSAPRTPLCALLRAPLPVSMAGMPAAQNEAFSRVLIDRAQEFSEWNLLDPHQVRFELNTVTGREDP